jgi:hypothetical protein
MGRGEQRARQWLPIPSGDPELAGPKRLVGCRAGDLVLWDSRTVHCSVPGSVTSAKRPSAAAASEAAAGPGRGLARVAALVAMTPRAFATEEVLALRRAAVPLARTLSHWPPEFHVMDEALDGLGGAGAGARPPTDADAARRRGLVAGLSDLTPEQRRLV